MDFYSSCLKRIRSRHHEIEMYSNKYGEDRIVVTIENRKVRFISEPPSDPTSEIIEEIRQLEYEFLIEQVKRFIPKDECFITDNTGCFWVVSAVNQYGTWIQYVGSDGIKAYNAVAERREVEPNERIQIHSMFYKELYKN